MSQVNGLLAKLEGLLPLSLADDYFAEFDYWTEAGYKHTVVNWLKGAQLEPTRHGYLYYGQRC